MGRSHRPERLGEEIRKTVSEMLVRGDLKDPRFGKGMIGLSGVDVTRDGSYATLYITCLSYSGKSLSEEDKKDVLSAFESSQGYIRSAVDRAVKVRHVPALIFKFDESYEYGAKMDRILDEIKATEEQKPDAGSEADEYVD
ncbi:MAG: 30S ribosome-binding factor RbfA [Firmicutes bacterium]|nr:30S ribosome-binding factor RbfA [Bacillota bacterium]